MNILFTCLPGYGHVHPMVPLADALAANGHEVVFAASPSFSGVVRNLGFRFSPAGMAWDESRLDETVPEIRDVPLCDRMIWLSKSIFLDRSPKSMVPDLLDIIDRLHPRVVVSNRFEVAGAIASEKTGIPVAGVHLSLRCSKALDRDFYGDELDALWRHFELPPDPEMAWLGRWLELSLMPPTWALPGFEKEPTEFFVRPEQFDRSGSEQLPAWIGRLPDQATVHATLGTVFNTAPGLVHTIIDAFRPPGLNLILTVGRGVDPGQFGALPPHIKVERYIPTSLLLSHIDVSINHGGHGSVMSVLARGIPMVVFPLSADQPFIAALACQHGVAVPLPVTCVEETADGMPGVLKASALKPEMVRALVDAALYDPRYRAAAQALAKTMASLPGSVAAAQLIERLALEQKPIYATGPGSALG